MAIQEEPRSYTFPTDKVFSFKEIITQELNYYRLILAQRTVDFHEAALRRTQDPTQVLNTVSGPKSISAITEMRIPNLKEARAYVAVLEKILKDLNSEGDQNEIMAKYWSDESLVLPEVRVPFVPPLEEKGDEKGDDRGEEGGK